MAAATKARSAPGAGLTRLVQESFSGGMYRSGDPALMPTNAFFDGTNCLLDLLGGVYKRGGSAYRSNTVYGTGIRMIWDGWLATTGQTTILASSTGFATLTPAGVIEKGFGSGLSNPARPAAYKGVLYLPGGVTYDGTTVGAAAKATAFYAVAGNRLVAAEGRTISFSKINTPGTFEAAEYLEVPEGVEILGLVGMRESVAVFTTGGLYVIGGVALNITDTNGNVQWRMDRYSGTVLWGNGAAVCEWEGNLVVPGTSAVWLVRRGTSSEAIKSFVRISQPIVDLYSEYVRAGYQPGQATVYGSHYLLPIIGGGRVVDLLVGRLDMAQRDGSVPWTHLAGYGAAMGVLETRVSAGVSREPTLLGGAYGEPARVLNLNWLVPGEGVASDADGSVPQFSFETRSIATGNLVPNLVARLRVRYQMSSVAGTARLEAALAGDAAPAGASVWGRFVWGASAAWATAGAAAYELLTGAAPESVDASTPHSWYPRRKRRFVRVRLTCGGAVSQLSLKALELFVRLDGRL
jgi:hypothetical protein